MELVKYEAARAALAVAVEIDEVKDLRDKAEAMAAYARQAKDTALVEMATELKVRAERRCGELLQAEVLKPVATLKRGPVVPSCDNGKKLPEIGLTRNESSRFQKLASIPEPRFEAAIAEAKATRHQVTTAGMLRLAEQEKPTKPTKPAGRPSKAAERRLEELKQHKRPMLLQYAGVLLRMVESEEDFSDEELLALRKLSDAICKRI